jgi:hypothetical protein
LGGILSNDDFSSILVYPRLDRRSDIIEERDLVNIYWEGVQEFLEGVQELQEFRSCRMGTGFIAKASVKRLLENGKTEKRKTEVRMGNWPRTRVRAYLKS